MIDKNIKGIEDIPGAIEVRNGRERHPIENIPGAIRVKGVPKKPTDDELRDRLINEARESQKNRKFMPPGHSEGRIRATQTSLDSANLRSVNSTLSQ